MKIKIHNDQFRKIYELTEAFHDDLITDYLWDNKDALPENIDKDEVIATEILDAFETRCKDISKWLSGIKIMERGEATLENYVAHLDLTLNDVVEVIASLTDPDYSPGGRATIPCDTFEAFMALPMDKDDYQCVYFSEPEMSYSEAWSGCVANY